MKDELLSELGDKCEMLCGGDGQGNSLWSARIADGLRQAGLSSVAMPQNDVESLKATFHKAELSREETRAPALAPEPVAPALRDVAPKAPGSSLG